MYSIVDQTDGFLLIDKSPGVSIHKDQQVAGLIMQVQRDLGLAELYPVHRLDRITSGLLLLAKNRAAATELSMQFQNQQVVKFYLALSDKKPKKKQGLVKGDMAKARRGSWKLMKSMGNPAITQFFSHSVEPGLRLFLLKPLSGKTHQIRVALKSVGAPIIGDQRYHEQTEVEPDRGYLHAYYLAFAFQGKDYHYRCAPRVGELFTRSTTRSLIDAWDEPAALIWPTV
ncbi:MAG: TIGR01621 family pseudouridine synthase [Amphritea sp.]